MLYLLQMQKEETVSCPFFGSQIPRDMRKCKTPNSRSKIEASNMYAYDTLNKLKSDHQEP